MKKFKTMAFDKKFKVWDIIEMEYTTKADFIKNLRSNGYRVNPVRVTEVEIYNYIMDNTNATDKDFKTIKKLPKNI